jgi:hemoglobin/transferrin/lactoferrin receptor protein
VLNSQYTDFGFSADAGIKLFDDHSLDFVYQRYQTENTGIPGGSSFAQTAKARYTLAKRELFKTEYLIPGFNIFDKIVFRASFQQISRNVEVIQNANLTLTPHAIHNTFMLQSEASIKPGENRFLVFGIEAWQRNLDSKRERVNNVNGVILEESPLPNSSFGSAGIYTQYKWQIKDITTLLLGGRYDAIKVSNETTYDTIYYIKQGQKFYPKNPKIIWRENISYSGSWNANAGLSRSFDGLMDLSLLFSTAFRSPSLEERYQYLNNGGVIHVGNPDLQPEKSIGLNFGMKFKYDILKMDADIYYNKLKNLVLEMPGMFEGVKAYVKNNIGEAAMYGYEFSMELNPLKELNLRSTLAYTRGEDTKNNNNLNQIPPLSGSFIINYTAGKYGSANMRCDAVSDKHFTALGESEISGYLLWNIGYKSSAFYISGMQAILSCGINNIFNAAYMNFLSTARGVNKLEPGRNIYSSLSINW